MSEQAFDLFSVLGIEIEYMLVDQETLSVQPRSDEILQKLSPGTLKNEVELDEICVSNELVMHVLELKNNGPKPVTDAVVDHFQQTINKLQPILAQYHLTLLPTGAHPWMNPHTETKRWPHGNNEIYAQYDTIFNCKGHGWANLQSMHVNLPFANDNEFCKLHSAVRLLLPILPALAASTPFLDGKPTGLLDSRLSFYDSNQRIIPSISGDIIPEYVENFANYQAHILQPMYRDIAPFDPNSILQEEWLNSRGAIPKFEYGALEIRILDSQECVQADIAIAHLIHYLLKSWVEDRPDLGAHLSSKQLKAIYDKTLKDGLSTIIDDKEWLAIWQLPKRAISARDVWGHLFERVQHAISPITQQVCQHILSYGNLSERLLAACHGDYAHEHLRHLYQQLNQCLLTNTLFRG